MYAHTPEDLNLIKGLARLDGLEILGELLCYIDPEDGTYDLKTYDDQLEPKREFDTNWNFLYPVHVREGTCICKDADLINSIETEWDETLKTLVPIHNPHRFFGHSIYCLDTVPRYLGSIDNLISVANKISPNWDSDTKHRFAMVVLSKDLLDLAKFLVESHD